MSKAKQSRVPEYNEGQSFTANFKFFDSAWLPSSPLTARYRIDCLTTGKAIVEWTAVTATQEIDIEVAPETNVIQSSNNPRERKQMVVQSNHGTSTQSVQTSEWDVKNLQGVT